MITLSAREAYRDIAAVYNSALNPVTSLERRAMAQALPPLKDRFVADIGSGTGYWAEYANARGARAIALDGCFEMLDQGPRPAVQGDAARLPFADAAVDLVICSLTLGYIPSAFSELTRVLKSGGILFVSDLHPYAIGRGWNRSFRIGSQVVRAEHTAYKIDSLQSPSLRSMHFSEHRFAAPEQRIFEQAGKGDRFLAAAECPAIFVAGWVKT